MKIIFLALMIFINSTAYSYASCVGEGECLQEIQYLAQNIPSNIISSIQSQFGGRVIGTQVNSQGNTQIQIIKQDNTVIIVTVDSSGNVIGVQQ